MERLIRSRAGAVGLFVLGVLFCAAGLVALDPAIAQTVMSKIQPIALSDGTLVTAASPLPITLDADKGAGIVEADTLRTVTASDSPDNVLLGTIDADTSTIAVDTTSMDGTLTLINGDSATIAADTTSLDSKTPALGQTVMASSTPVAIASDQSTIPTDLDTVGGTATTVNVGAPAAGTQRTVEAQPDGPSVNSALTAADQVDGISIAANANRANLLIQSSGTTTCLVAIGAATGGTDGVILAGGTADDDGTGGTLTTESVEAIYIYDLSGAGTCKYRSIQEVW